MKPFTPQLSQQDLSEMIDREGLAFERRSEAITEWRPPMDLYQENKNASWYVGGDWEIRLAPGALTEFGLLPSMVPHNPRDLPADQITEGGKWRAFAKEELDGRHRGKGYLEYWEGKKWAYGGLGSEESTTYRVPVNTPFPKLSRTEPPAEQPQQAGQSLTPRTDAWRMMINGLRLSDAEAFLKLDELTRTLETELTAALAQRDEALDTLDLMCDEFQRIKALADLPYEALTFCDRAISGIKQRVPLVEQRDKAEKERDEANRLLGDVKRVLQEIYDDTEGYADGALDASAHDRLCNDISSKIRQPLTQITNHLKP